MYFKSLLSALFFNAACQAAAPTRLYEVEQVIQSDNFGDVAVLFTLDSEFYEDASAGGLIQRLISSVRVEHPDPIVDGIFSDIYHFSILQDFNGTMEIETLQSDSYNILSLFTTSDANKWKRPASDSEFKGSVDYDRRKNSLRQDLLRLTQDPVTEATDSSWTRSWFVERTLASSPDERERARSKVFNGSCWFNIEGSGGGHKGSDQEKEETELYFQYAAFISSPVDQHMINSLQKTNSQVQQMQKELDDVNKSVKELISMLKK